MNSAKALLISLTLLSVISVINTSAQEVITPLMVNPNLINQKPPANQINAKITLNLPFIEDFSDGKWYPSPLRWSDALVYINNDYPVKPPSIGVATFDALNAHGAIYDNASHFPFPADTLTSHDIDLSNLKQSDSVFMSFHYQPAGIGNAPERDDSLVLEFWSLSLQEWVHVWADRGRSLAEFYAQRGKYFDMVLLPVDSMLFFSGEFKFRFRNYASITDNSLPDWGGNVDMWHVDYIVIKANRSSTDTIIRDDIAFRAYPKSMLENYYSMPWNQYLANPAAEMKYDVAIPYTAYFYNTSSPINQIFHVNSLSGGTSYTPTPYNFGNIAMPVDTVVIPKPATGFETFIFSAPSSPYADFELLAWLSPFSVNEAIRTNDTVRFYQKFYNYYAYDDASPEAGYGLSASNPNVTMKLALRFDLNVPDTLRAVQMFFNQTKDLANDIDFTLTVWQANGNAPGDTLYSQKNLRPVFVDGLNQYHTYVLNRPIAVNGSFYVGWQQKSGTMLNVGYDRNHDAREYTLFNIGTGWNQSQFSGAVMMRPILGDTTGAYINVPEVPARINVRVFPNPASQWLNIEIEGSNDLLPYGNFRVELFNTHGQRVLESYTDGRVELPALSNGLYLLRVSDHTGSKVLETTRIVIRQ